ncbi:MAG: hypothetical protein ACHQF3_13375, partial [Alphaproteobacteria bacterium]
GKRTATPNRAGGQMWLNYAETWRVAGEDDRFLIVSGSRPMRDWRMGDPLDGQEAESFALVTMMPQCLPR